MSFLPRLMLVLMLSGLLLPPALASEAMDYPRSVTVPGARLSVHHPVIDQWQRGYVEGWIPIQVQLDGSEKTWVGSVRARARADVRFEQRVVELSEQAVLDVRFSGQQPPAEVINAARQTIRERSNTILLDELLSMLADDFDLQPQSKRPLNFRFSPPQVVVVNEPTGLLLIDGQPVLAGISQTALDYVVNTDWQVFFHRQQNQWYVLNGDSWQRHSLLATGGWTSVDALPEDFQKLTSAGPWAAAVDHIPARQAAAQPLAFVIGLEPTELIEVKGQIRLGGIPGTGGLQEVTNTPSPLFKWQQRWYLLASGRWFTALQLEGKWEPVEQLPQAFQQIPAQHERGWVRASVPGTHEAIAAMIEASLPRASQVSASAQPGQTVAYAGPPEFEPIDGTALSRAVNTPFAVIGHNNYYYLALDAVWYSSRYPQGPWQVARHLPDEIFNIPPQDPLHYVSYLRPAQSEAGREDTIRFQYNAGYLGEYSTDVSVVYGTGFNYAPWVGTYRGMPYWQGYRPPYGGYYPHHGGQHWGYGYAPGMPRQTVLIESPPRGVGGQPADPSFQDPALPRRGVDYSLGAAPVNAPSVSSAAEDDWYTDEEGRVYRRAGDGWQQHGGEGWDTMASLERQYGVASPQLEAPESGQRQAYRQNPEDIERMERYYQRRSNNYNIHANIYVRP